MKTYKASMIAVLVSMLAGCGIIADGPKIADNPPPSTLRSAVWHGKFTGEAHPQDPVNGMSVIFLKLHNDTDVPRSISTSRVFGVTADEKSISALSADKREVLAPDGKARRLVSAGAGLVAGAAGGAVFGGAVGAVGGTLLGPPGMAAGAAIGAAIGGGTGAIVGAIAGAFKTPTETNRSELKTHDNDFRDQTVRGDSQAQGYIYLPKDDYRQLRLIVFSDAEGTQELTVPIARQN